MPFSGECLLNFGKGNMDKSPIVQLTWINKHVKPWTMRSPVSYEAYPRVIPNGDEVFLRKTFPGEQRETKPLRLTLTI